MSAPNPATALPKPLQDAPGPEPSAGTGGAGVRFDDRPMMLIGSVGFGLAIPWLAGLFGPYRPPQALWWAGQAWFIVLALAIWGGNRWLLFKQREHLDWFSQPMRKLLMLVTANVLYTAPVTLLGLLAWFALAGLPVDRNALQVVALANVICVLFVTHAYETLFLIRERESDLMRVERLERLRAQAELGALKAQVDPHFLFNSLNSLGHLMTRDALRAREFCDLLAEVYRYVLDSRQRDLVPLAAELDFLRQYHRLLTLRFGAAITLDGDGAWDKADIARWQVAPMALQTLLENAVKHNQALADAPLRLDLRLHDGTVTAGNAVRPRLGGTAGGGIGLANLDERCRWLAGRGLVVRDAGGRFEVEVPLVPAQERP
ncbi:MAG: sensor histidine kinase [Aquabacterium sp.]